MTRRIILIIFYMVLCGIYCAAQDQVQTDTLQCVIDTVQNNDSITIREPMTPGDSLRYVVDSWLDKNNYTQKKTATKTVTKTEKIRGKRGRYRTVSKQVKVPYTTYVKQNFTVGCCIYDLTADSMLYTFNADKMMIPASTQKLYVATAMLEKRGLNYTFDTKAFTDGKIEVDSVGRKYLGGNIYIATTCDPTLDKFSPNKILKDIELLEIDSIDGQVIQCVTPQSKQHKLPEDIFASYIVRMLEKDSIALQYNTASESAVNLNGKMRCLSHLSTSMNDVLDLMLRRSNNTYAECMLLNLCDNDSNWTYSGCKGIVCDLVEKIYKRYNNDECDISESYYNIKDGSGLSHSNKTSARSQVDLLRYIYSNKKIFTPIYDHLPIAGVSGTLSKRMRDGLAYDNVHAKTGTVNYTKTLSGYVMTASDHMIAFSILFNNISDTSLAKRLQDKICEFLAGLVI